MARARENAAALETRGIEVAITKKTCRMEADAPLAAATPPSRVPSIASSSMASNPGLDGILNSTIGSADRLPLTFEKRRLPTSHSAIVPRGALGVPWRQVQSILHSFEVFVRGIHNTGSSPHGSPGGDVNSRSSRAKPPERIGKRHQVLGSRFSSSKWKDGA